MILSLTFAGGAVFAGGGGNEFSDHELNDFLFRVYTDLKLSEVSSRGGSWTKGIFLEKVIYRKDLDVLDVVYLTKLDESMKHDGKVTKEGREHLISVLQSVGESLGIAARKAGRGGAFDYVRYSNVSPYDKKKAKLIKKFCKKKSVIRLIDMSAGKWLIVALNGEGQVRLFEADQPMDLKDIMSEFQ